MIDILFIELSRSEKFPEFFRKKFRKVSDILFFRKSYNPSYNKGQSHLHYAASLRTLFGGREVVPMVPLERALLSSYRLPIVLNHSAIYIGLATICNANFNWRFRPQISLSGGEATKNSVKTVLLWTKRYLIPSKGLSRVHDCDRRTDGVTDHAT